MNNSPRDKLRARFNTFNKNVNDDRIDIETAKKIVALVYAYDEDVMIYDDKQVVFEVGKPAPTKPDGEKFRKPSTLMSWVYRLLAFAKERSLVEATANELNADVQRMRNGSHPSVTKSDSITKDTLASYQAALRKFYTYHDLGVDPSDIVVYSVGSSPVNPQDMLTREEIHEVRETPDNPRDRLIVDLLIYTGQRREALRTLRIKDIDLQQETFTLNTDAGGLKYAEQRNGTRPLLAAISSVRSWINEYHPDPKPDNYLITVRSNFAATDPTNPVSGETIRRIMSVIKKECSVDKPLHPHALRHNYVTLCKKQYNMDNDTIKYLIGHKKDSNVMERTYSHLSGDDYTKKAKEAAGLIEPEDDSPMTPDMCPTCSEPVAPTAKACGKCGTLFTPDAKAAHDRLQKDMRDSAKQVVSEQDNEDYDEIIDFIDENESMFREFMETVQKRE